MDDLEPYATCSGWRRSWGTSRPFPLPGLGHFGPWLWPDVMLGLLSGE